MSSEAAGGYRKIRTNDSGAEAALDRSAARNPTTFCGDTREHRHRTAQHYQGTHCLTGVNLRRRYSAVIVPLIVPRFVIVRLLDITGGEGEACSE